MADTETGIGTWQDASWSKGVPGAHTDAKIDGVVLLDQDETVKSLKIASGAELILTDANLTTKNGVVDNGLVEGAGVIQGDIEGNGIVEAFGGDLEINGAVDETADKATTLAATGSSTLAIDGAVGSDATFSFLGKSATLDLTGEGVGSNDFHATIDDFAKGDEIVVASAGKGDSLTFNSSSDILTVENKDNVALEELQLSGAYSANEFKLTNSNGTDTITTTACFMRGSRILTHQGYVAIEDLKIGDRVTTHSGATRSIVWIGHREVDCARHPAPEQVWPICVSRNAFGEGLPTRDLWLSPGHNVFCEGVIMPIDALVNEKTILQQTPPTAEYWHIELETHDIVFSEGLPSETYLDTGNRNSFANGGEFIELYPDFAAKRWFETCVPLEIKGDAVSRTKAKLLARVKSLGYEVTTDPDLHVVADELRIDPIKVGKMRFAFVIPPDSENIKLMSRTFIPAHTVADSSDKRKLGVCVKRLQVDEEELSLDYGCQEKEGWSILEANHRWTTGATLLKPGARLVIVDLARHGFFWDEARVTSHEAKAA
jgi:hypothetical protein